MDLVYKFILKRFIHPGIEVGLDLFFTIGATFAAVVGLISAQSTLEWDASHWHNDAPYEAYHAKHPNGTIYEVPARNYTPCSGFANCEEQDAYTNKTHHRAIVELVGVGFAFLTG